MLIGGPRASPRPRTHRTPRTCTAGGVLVVSWYSKHDQGSRLTFLDLDTRRYRHVLLVVPTLTDGCPDPRAVARARRRHRLAGALPARRRHRARRRDLPARRPHVCPGRREPADARLPLPAPGPVLLPRGDRRRAGAAALLVPVARPRGGPDAAGRRRVRQPPPDPSARPLPARPGDVDARGGRRRLQPAARPRRGGRGPDAGRRDRRGAGGTSRRRPGTGCRGRSTSGAPARGAGTGGRPRWDPRTSRWWPSSDLLWSVTEHPRRRWVFSMRRSWFD